MGFFSSLFGSKRSSEPSSTVVQAQSIPKEVAPYLKEVLEGYQDLYQNQLERGYQEYGGETIAPLTAAQESALSGLEGLRGATQPMYETAAQKAVGAGQQFTPEAAQQYMSPYQQAVTDVELREAQRRFEGTVLPKLEAQAVNQGAMSGLGSRAGVEMAEAQRSQNQLLADIQAKGQQKAFEAASKQFEAERGRERLVGQDLSQLAGQGLTSQITELGAQKAVGEERQQLGQLNLDEAYRKYLEKQEFPETALTTYSGGVYGNPMSRTFDQTQSTFGAQPSTGQSLLSLGLSGLGMYGMGKKIYNSKEGGYVDQGLPTVYRQTNDQVGTGDDDLAIGQTIGNIFERIQQSLTPSEATTARIRAANAKRPSLSLMGPIGSVPVTDNNPVTDINNQLARQTFQKLNPLETVSEKKVREQKTNELLNQRNKEIANLEEKATALEIQDGSKPTFTSEEEKEISDFYKTQQDPNDPVSLKEEVTVKETITADKGTPKIKTKKTSLTDTNVLDTYIKSHATLKKMVDDKITSMGELQTQLKDAIKADKTGTKESRNNRNELAFWRSFIAAGEAVGAADPSKGFMNALSKGATAGGKSLADARMKLEEEAKGDGKKAIDAIKTLMVAETADLKLQQVSTASSGEVAKVLAAWAKANNLKNQSVKKYSEITKVAEKLSTGATAVGSQGRNDYHKALLVLGANVLSETGSLSKAIDAMGRYDRGSTESEDSTGRSGRTSASSVKKPRPFG